MWFDTHTHLTDECFDSDRQDIITQLSSNNVCSIIDVGTNFEDSTKAIINANTYSNVYAAVGIHPDYITDLDNNYINRLSSLATSSKKVVGIGEIGLDYHYNVDPKEYQMQKMNEQIKLAIDLNLPVIIHDRDAHKDCLDTVKKYGGNLRGVFHCFSASLEMAKEIFNLGMYISIGGPITFKNEKKLKAMAKDLDLNRVLVETDSPCLSPEPLRGKRNVPANINYTGDVLANCIGISSTELQKITTNNAYTLFRIEEKH